MEREEHVYLPDQFEIKQVPPYSFAEKEAIIGRIHEFYFVSIVVMAHGSINCLRTR